MSKFNIIEEPAGFYFEDEINEDWVGPFSSYQAALTVARATENWHIQDKSRQRIKKFKDEPGA